MKILKPIYYNDFKCTANQCIDGCCSNWNIDIDKKTYIKYKNVKGEFGKKINSAIVRNRKSKNELTYGKMKLDEERKCKFLNGENLCEIHKNMGADYLCNTCKLYPRIIRNYVDIIEKNLYLSCPEIAKVLIDIKDKVSFVIEDEVINKFDRDNISFNFENNKIYNVFWKARSFFIEISQYREIELWKRLSLIKLSQEKFQRLIEVGNFDEVDNLISNLSQVITNKDIIRSLENIADAKEVKNLFINSIVNLRTSYSIFDKDFFDMLSDLKQILDENKNNQLEVFNNIEKDFEIYFKDREYILENFVVYNLYKYCMEGINKKDLNEAITITMIEYALLKSLLAVRLTVNNGTLNDDDIVKVLYSFARGIEHNVKFMKRLYKNIKDAGYDSLAYLTILVR